jgi:hypothetical protein
VSSGPATVMSTPDWSSCIAIVCLCRLRHRRHSVAFRTMSRAFYFSVVFCRNITDPTRHSPAPSIRLVPGGTCSDINLTGLATVAGATVAPQSDLLLKVGTYELFFAALKD